MGLTRVGHEENYEHWFWGEVTPVRGIKRKYIFVPLLGLVVDDAMTEGDNVVHSSKTNQI